MDVNRKELSTIKDALRDHPRGMTITEISKAVGLNRHSVAKYTEVLVASGHVDMRSFGPSKVYFLSQRVPISAMLSFSSDLIITLDKDLRARNVNDRLLKFTGLSREEVLNKNIENFSYSRQTEPPLMPYIQAALKGREESVDMLYRTGEGDYYFILKALPTVFEDGETGVTLIMTDITQRKKAEEALLKERGELEVRVKDRTAELEAANRKLKAEIGQRIRSEQALRDSEEKYRNLTENILDVVWELDRDGKFTYISPRIKDFLGNEPADFIGRTILDFMRQPVPDSIKAQYYKLFTDPEPYSRLESHLLHKDGHEVIMEAVGIIMSDERGNFLGYRGVNREVTARIKAEEAVRKAEEKYRNLVESINDVSWEIDDEGRFTYISPRIKDMLGYEPEDFLGKTIQGFLAPGHAGEITHGMVQLFSQPKPYNLQETHVLHKAGYELIVEANGIVLFDSDGKFRGYRGIIRDVTARKEAEEALRKAEEKYRNLVEDISEWIWETDLDGRYTYSSPNVYDLLGYRPDEITAMKTFDLMEPEYAKQMYAKVMALAERGVYPPVLEAEMLHKSGRKVFFEASGKPIGDSNGTVVGFRGVARDITARRQAEDALRKSEEKYRNLVENVADWIWETDVAGRFTYSSPRVYDILGYRPEEILGLRPFDLMVPEKGTNMYHKMKELASRGEVFTSLEGEHLRKDGRAVFVEVSGRPIRDLQGAVVGYTGIAHDITEKKRMEQALLESESRLRSTIENVNDIVWEMDRQARFTYVSPKVRDILGYGPEHYVGHIIMEFMPPEDVAKFSEGFGRIFANPRPYSLEYLRMYRRDGSIISAEVNGSPFYDEKGQFCGFQGVTRDITNRKLTGGKSPIS